jgi:hypothetical protein
MRSMFENYQYPRKRMFSTYKPMEVKRVHEPSARGGTNIQICGADAGTLYDLLNKKIRMVKDYIRPSHLRECRENAMQSAKYWNSV